MRRLILTLLVLVACFGFGCEDDPYDQDYLHQDASLGGGTGGTGGTGGAGGAGSGGTGGSNDAGTDDGGAQDAGADDAG